MGRTLKRVALDFDWPLGKVWYGYLNPYQSTQCPYPDCDAGCGKCDEGEIWAPGVKELHERWVNIQPPAGPGFQLWNTTTEGHPMSPVFKTLGDLCAWLGPNATLHGYEKISAEEWFDVLREMIAARERALVTAPTAKGTAETADLVRKFMDQENIPYRDGYMICPRAHNHPFYVGGIYIFTGWVIIRNHCNVAPAASWFSSVSEAKDGIDAIYTAGGHDRPLDVDWVPKWWDLMGKWWTKDK